jgi:hypothetical protein
MLARRFLWVVAGVIIVVFIGALTYRLFEQQLLKTAMVPTVTFQAKAAEPALRYESTASWIARPDIPGNPALWLPTGYAAPTPEGSRLEEGAKEPEKAAVFFIHPTSFLDRSTWNAPIDDPDSQQRARLFVRHQASAFNGVGEIWAPKYRQATFGAFLTTKEDAEKALAFAYRDVLAAFDAFVKQVDESRPIILAAHSQGSLHLTKLLRERIASTPLAKRVVAAYVVGWPISMAADLELLGLPACETPGQSGCILSWQSFGEPADPKMVTDVYDASVAPNGKRRAGSRMLCVNPVTGTIGGGAPAEANLGTIIPNSELTEGELKAGGVPARCDVSGFLLIGEDIPDLPPYILPGNNYHVFDYALFWSNIRADAEARLKGFRAK